MPGTCYVLWTQISNFHDKAEKGEWASSFRICGNNIKEVKEICSERRCWKAAELTINLPSRQAQRLVLSPAPMFPALCAEAKGCVEEVVLGLPLRPLGRLPGFSLPWPRGLTHTSQLWPGLHSSPALRTKGSCLARNHILLQLCVRKGGSRCAWTRAGPGPEASGARPPRVHTGEFSGGHLSHQLWRPMMHRDEKTFKTTKHEKTEISYGCSL